MKEDKNSLCVFIYQSIKTRQQVIYKIEYILKFNGKSVQCIHQSKYTFGKIGKLRFTAPVFKLLISRKITRGLRDKKIIKSLLFLFIADNKC